MCVCPRPACQRICTKGPPQPVVEASVETTTCLDTCSRGTPAQRKQGPTMGWRCGGRTGWLRPGTCRGAMPISGPGREANTEAVSYEAIRAAWPRLRMPYAPGASENVSVEPPSCAEKTPGISALTERAPLRDVLWGWPSPTPYPCVHTTVLEIGQG